MFVVWILVGFSRVFGVACIVLLGYSRVFCGICMGFGRVFCVVCKDL